MGVVSSRFSVTGTVNVRNKLYMGLGVQLPPLNIERRRRFALFAKDGKTFVLCPPPKKRHQMGLDRGPPPAGFASAETLPGKVRSRWGSGTTAIISATHLELRWV